MPLSYLQMQALESPILQNNLSTIHVSIFTVSICLPKSKIEFDENIGGDSFKLFLIMVRIGSDSAQLNTQ